MLTPGQDVEVDMDADILTDLSTGKEYPLKPLGEVRACSYTTTSLMFLPSTFLLMQCSQDTVVGQCLLCHVWR